MPAAVRWRSLDDQRGIALVAVLWVVTLLALVAAVFMREVRTDLALTRNLENEAKAEALAEAGVNRAILVLLGLDTTVPWRVDGSPVEFAFEGGRVRVAIQDEGGKIDLNRSSAAILQALFAAAGLTPDAARTLADAVIDFRDADALRQADGAEDDDYAAAGLPHDAKDAPFTSIEELLQVYGMTPDLYGRLAPLVTVYAPRRDINLGTAPPEVLRALPHLSAEQIADILDRRATGGAPRPFRVITATVVAEATTAEGGRFIREAVLRRSGSAGHPFNFLRWRRRWPAEAG